MRPQTFAMVTGSVVGATGLMGMISPMRKPMVEHIKDMKLRAGYSKIAGAIPTNRLFNWVRLGIGLTGLIASRNRKSAIAFNRMIAANYAAMAAMGAYKPTKTFFGLLPIFGGNVWLHAGTAIGELFAEEELMDKVMGQMRATAGTQRRPADKLLRGRRFENQNAKMRPLNALGSFEI